MWYSQHFKNKREVYHLLVKNKRPGLTDEYFVAPEQTWAEPIPLKDRVLSRHKISTEETDPSLQGTGCDELEPVLYEDTYLVEAEELFEQSIEYHKEWLNEEDDVPSVRGQTLGPSIWRRNPDATRYCQIPPIHNQSVGVEIQHQMETEGLTAQAVVERAIAFSKIPKLILVMFCAIAQKLQDVYNSLMQLFPQRQNTEAQQKFFCC